MFMTFAQADLKRLANLQPADWSDIVPFFRLYIAAPFCWPIKVEQDGELAAVGTIILNAQTCWLAHIIVEPTRRRQGLGMAVTRRLIEIGRERGRTTQLLIATEMGRPLYEKLGFSTSCEYTFHGMKRLEPVPPCDEIRKFRKSDLPDLLALDRAATGEDRRLMIERDRLDGWVYVDRDDRMLGFYLPDLGEGPVVAANAPAGTALLRLRIGSSNEKAVLPTDNRTGMDKLAEAGLTVSHTASRMVLGGADPLTPSWIYNRVGGHFG